jgi:hypothetical protein
MSEEEAIERLKERVKLDRKIRNNKIESDYEQFCENECQAIETILNLADKQQKEIEEKNVAINKMSKDISRQLKEIEKLNFENHMIKKWNEQLDKNYISKDKIREIIEHYNNELEHIKNGEEFENEKPMYYWGKVALEELLEEN